jgi:hypothetical protein
LNGRIVFNRSPTAWKESEFSVDFATVRARDNTDQKAFRLETKVLTKEGGLPTLKKHTQFVSDVAKWLDFAHGLTSPFFKKFIARGLMAKLEAD